MWQSKFDLPDTESDRVRSLIATIDAELAGLERAPRADGAGDPLVLAWKELTTLLAIDPAPTTQNCPTCGKMSRSAATRCVHCWASLRGEGP